MKYKDHRRSLCVRQGTVDDIRAVIWLPILRLFGLYDACDIDTYCLMQYPQICSSVNEVTLSDMDVLP